MSLMPEFDSLRDACPGLSAALPRRQLAVLPTPVKVHDVTIDNAQRRIAVKYDNLTSARYGGNKVRKLEYIFPRANAKKCERVATFGAAGSNHALATALLARQVGLGCTCFLFHQAKTPLVARTLNMHLQNGTELVRFGGSYSTRVRILRDKLWGRNAWVIPMGGSSWLGTVGFVAAGLELAAQVSAGEIPSPHRIYVATGTMGTAVGLALGLALAGLTTTVHAVRVSDLSIMNGAALQTLLGKTALMMRRVDPAIPNDLAARCNIEIRDEFFAPGYGQGSEATGRAIGWAADTLGLALETTYTGKAVSALLADLGKKEADGRTYLYWHTYNSAPLDVPDDAPLDAAALPAEFHRYFDGQARAQE